MDSTKSRYDTKRAETRALVDRSRESGLMHAAMEARKDTRIRIKGQDVVSFTNCSYLGFDTHPEVIAAAQRVIAEWGVHYCCARSRLSIGPLAELERRLSRLFGTPAITFPSVTSTHAAVIPLLASGLLREDAQRPARFIFDRYAHASMQVLKPNINAHGKVITIEHNDMRALERELDLAQRLGEDCVFFCDSVYSMGGVSPLAELLSLQERFRLYLYIDDAHGTSIFGKRGEGYVAQHFPAHWPRRLFATFSLAKGFGTNGGGILLPNATAEDTVRYYGQTYAFSGPLDFAIVGAALKVVDFHENGQIVHLQNTLRRKVALVDAEMGASNHLPFSPIRMVAVGDEADAVAIAEGLMREGFYVPAVFYPVVPKGSAQLRLCLTVKHEDEDLRRLCRLLRDMDLSLDDTCMDRTTYEAEGKTKPRSRPMARQVVPDSSL